MAKFSIKESHLAFGPNWAWPLGLPDVLIRVFLAQIIGFFGKTTANQLVKCPDIDRHVMSGFAGFRQCGLNSILVRAFEKVCKNVSLEFRIGYGEKENAISRINSMKRTGPDSEKANLAISSLQKGRCQTKHLSLSNHETSEVIDCQRILVAPTNPKCPK